jgi:hypothetical protein
MSIAVEQPGKVWTEADLEALPDDGYSYELVNGELVMSAAPIQHPRRN